MGIDEQFLKALDEKGYKAFLGFKELTFNVGARASTTTKASAAGSANYPAA